MNYWVIFLTGLTTGGLTCLAMQGGLLASLVANQKDRELETAGQKASTKPGSFDRLDWLPVVLFLASKLVAHMVVGFGLGLLGSQIQLSLGVRLIFQTLAAFFMLATAGNLLDLHPLFRYVAFQPPKFLMKSIRNTTTSQALFAPALLGVATIFVPCGVTQAMEVLAVASGNPWTGALIMGAFVLGTSPIFALVGIGTAKLSETFRQQFLKVAALLLVGLAVTSLNGVLTVLDSPLTLQKLTRPVTYFFSRDRFTYGAVGNSAVDQTGTQKVRINVNSHGYSPRYIKVKAGVPVDLTVATNNSYSCANYFTLNAFNIDLELGPTDQKTVSFTPDKPGKYTFSCSMGMYTGTLEVI